MENATFINEFTKGDNSALIMGIKSNSIDMILTSPPYDDMREYDGIYTWNFKVLSHEMHRVLKPGGVLVWVVGDPHKDGNESLSSSKQKVYLVEEAGFNILDTMIYQKIGIKFPMNNCYYQIFEYMFVFTKGKTKTYNPIKDRKNKTISKRKAGKVRRADGVLKPEVSKKGKQRMIVSKPMGVRYNIWPYVVGSNIGESQLANLHPAPFPLHLAIDHIISWTMSHDVVLDPFMGGGTTAVACMMTDRNFIGFETNASYIEIAKDRIQDVIGREIKHDDTNLFDLLDVK